jgi:hypothetical protein
VVRVAPEWLIDRQPVLRFLTREQTTRLCDRSILRLVEAYDPEREFVVTLLKEGNRINVYRVKALRDTNESDPAVSINSSPTPA